MKYQVRHSLYVVTKNLSNLYEFDPKAEPTQFDLESIPNALSQFEKWSISEYGYDYLVANIDELIIEPYVTPIELSLDEILAPMRVFLDDLDALKDGILNSYHWYRWDYETLVNQISVNIDIDLDVPQEYDDEDDQYDYYREHREELHELVSTLINPYECFNFGRDSLTDVLTTYVEHLFNEYGKANNIPSDTPIKLI